MQSININVTKIDKSAIVDGKNGKYVSLVLFENKNGPDQYGNDGFVTQDLGKQRREAGERGPIIGNWRHIGQARPAQQQAAPAPAQGQDDGDDVIPF